MKTIEQDVIAWFEWVEKCESGNLGYRKHSQFEPTSHSNKRTDPTPDHAIPSHLIFIDGVMLDMPRMYRKALKSRFTPWQCDLERAQQINVSVSKYYALCREAFAYLTGAYGVKDTTRRLKKAVNEAIV